MTPEKQQITIAEACGYKLKSIPQNPNQRTWQYNGITRVLPDYLNDLNAIHEAEKVFIGNASSAMTYAMHILRVRGQDINNENDDLNCDHAWIAANATATERAEAFLKTLDLWE